MTTLTATAVITAVDRASAVFARVGSNARALSGRFMAAAGGVSRLGQAAAMNLGLPATMIGAISGRTEYEIDKMSRLMQSAGELSDEQRKMLTKAAFDVSTRTGQSAADVLKGQRELILGGLDAETAAMSSEIIAKVSRANDVAAEKVAEDAITNASALGLAMGSTTEKVAALRKTLDFMSVVPAFSPMNWDDLSTSMKYVGPVAGALKIQMNDLGAALSMLAFAGFKGEEAGTALRTILTRLIAPTRKARIELAAAGIDPSDLFKIDEAKVNDKSPLLDALEQQGLMTGKERAGVEKRLGRIDASKFKGNMFGYTAALNSVLVKGLGIGKGDTQDREILKAAIDNHIFRAVSDLDLEKSFVALKDVPLKVLKEVFGLQRMSQAKALNNKLNEIVTLPTGERISAWRKLRDELGGAIEGAADRKAEVTLRGFWATIDRLKTAFENMNHQIFASGFGDQLSGVFEKLSSGIGALAQTDPEKLQKIGWAITALMTAPLVGMGPAGLAALALAFTDLGKMFSGGRENVLGAAGGIVTKDTVAPMVEAFQAVKNLFSEISAAVAPVISAIKNLFGMDAGASLLGGSLKLLANTLNSIAGLIKGIRQSMGGVPEPLKNSDAGQQWGRFGPGGPRADMSGSTGDGLGHSFDAGAAAVRERRERLLGISPGPSVPIIPSSPQPPAMIRDSFPDAGMQRVDVRGQATVGVTGQVQGEIRSEITVRYEGPLGGPDAVIGSGRVSGQLDRGESTLDLDQH